MPACERNSDGVNWLPAFRSLSFELQGPCSTFASWRARIRYTQALAFRLKRLAVTEEQIEEWSLPTRPTKRSDSRARSFGSSVSVDLGVAYASTPRGEGGAGTLKFKTK